jgi:peptidoglycan hydrolase-like protein with peptidoglycan-binding domain
VVEHETAPATPRRARRIGLATVGVIAALVVGYAGWAPKGGEPPQAPAATSTVKVVIGSMVSETRASGTVHYASTTTIASGQSGVVTEVPAPGATLGPGAVAYRVDTRPVTVLAGTLPAWRDFESGMTDGEDIRQLEQNLKAFGFFTREPDSRFTWDTTAAIQAWQKSLGVERTGTVQRAMIHFSGQDLKVAAVQSGVGTEVGPGSPLYQATSLDQVIELNVKSTDRALAVAGGSVTVILPSGATTEGTVETVAAPVSKPDAAGKSSIVVPVRVAVADQAAIADLALASVSVSFASAVTENALTVPVDALVPISDTRFAVELPRAKPGAERKLMPVTVGAFGSGVVEISGDRIVAGLTVVVPAR